jgi:predicted GNAT family N-acyltransferase
MEEFRKLDKTDLYDIIQVAKLSYSKASLDKYVMDDILACFDDNQRNKVELFGIFRNDKLVSFSGFNKSRGIGNTYMFRLATTLPEFRRMGYLKLSFEKRLEMVKDLIGEDSGMIQLSTQIPHFYDEYGFIDSGFKTKGGFHYLYKVIND